MPIAAILAVSASLAAAPAADACAAASAPLPSVAGVDASALEAVEDYRAAWRRACEGSGGPADLSELLSDAEAITADVSTSAVLEQLASALPERAPWPFPAVRRGDTALEADWAALAAAAHLGTAEDGRFFRGARVAAGRRGDPSWLGEPVPGGGGRRCVRLGEVSWADVADAIDDMEGARSPAYARYARALRQRLLETLGELARGPRVCGCFPGDASVGLAPLATSLAPERLGTPARRALAKAASEALEAMRVGRARVLWLRETKDAPPTGCGASP